MQGTSGLGQRLNQRRWDGDLLAVTLLAIIVVVELRLLWRTGAGVINFIDYNLPVSAETASVALKNSVSPWSGGTTLGAPNVGFLGTSVFLGGFSLLAAIFDVTLASRLLLICLVWLVGIGCYGVLRWYYALGPAASLAAALFYVCNPWVYDTVAQGHLYALEVLVIVPFLVLAVPKIEHFGLGYTLVVGVVIALAVGCDYHFGALVLAFLALEVVGLAISGKPQRAGRLVLASALGMGLLAVYLLPYITILGSINANNSPSTGDLLYFSRFTSWHSAFTLVRPGLNASEEMLAQGRWINWLWVAGAVAVCFAAWSLVVSGLANKLTGSWSLPIAAFASVVLGNGANGVTRGAAIWAYSHIPFAQIFRDPSKFLIFALLLYVPVVGAAAQWGVFCVWDPRQVRSPLGPRPRLRPYLSVLSVVVFLGPLLTAGVATISQVPKDAEATVREAGTRIAYLPPGQYVRYPGQPSPVNDPVQLYGKGIARLGPDYDTGAGNRFLRWLYSSLYFRRTTTFFNNVRLAAISRVVERPGVEVVPDSPTARQFLTPSNVGRALEAQDPVPRTHAGRYVLWEGDATNVISASTRLVRIDGSNLDVVLGLGALADLGSAAVCITDECPADQDAISVAEFGPAPPTSIEDLVAVGVTGSYDTAGASSSWIDGSIASAEADGLISAQLVPVAVGIRAARGPLTIRKSSSFPGELWLQVLRGPSSVAYSVSCGKQTMTASSAPTISSYSWTWMRMGTFQEGSEQACQAVMDGPIGAIAGGTVVNPSHSAPGEWDLRVAPGIAATGWAAASGADVGRHPVLASTSVVVQRGGGLTFAGNAAAGDHVFAEVAGLDDVPSVGVLRDGVTADRVPVPARAGWIDLGPAPSSSSAIDIEVVGGTVGVLRVALATPAAMEEVRGLAESAVPIRTSGNVGLVTAREARVEVPTGTGPIYVIVRAATDGQWKLDGRPPDGLYAGYGLIYRVAPGDHVLRANLLMTARVGAGVSVAVAVAMAIAALTVPRRHLATRRKDGAPT